jgi:hypothetical protein
MLNRPRLLLLDILKRVYNKRLLAKGPQLVSSRERRSSKQSCVEEDIRAH